uniref:McKusick-Kaufman/Bardet-Biedl syndromes putative chaperonin n=1 Tax=Oncorhynchus gorbuscha TaxID=8017 RepID=UPI001EAF1317|nr:McKusick-Kaufman/Bardet-Biedl syndromes putative chaperonin [Oncorhynchus gorbuscha]XP_046223771.1 McKusick-Kaufman/Bardet-Biedl syndromes putative chaperonin [Oncorhynchus gorbuscha]
MSRVTKKASSVCTDSPLSMNEVCRKMTLMRQILTSCFGPNGRLKQVHNNVGGHVLTTSTSTSLLQAVSSSEPLLKLITASILNHLSRFSDCGLYTGILCFSLIDHVQKSGLRPSVAIKINKQLLEVCTSFLNQEDCGCKVNVDFNSCQSLVTLARSVISSKPACVLTGGEQQHISTLAVHAFLLTVPCGDTPGSPDRVRLGRTVTVSIEGQFVLDSAVFPGLLVNLPDMQLHPTDSERTRREPGPFRLALFTVSLSGDLSEFGEGSLEVHSGSPDPEDLILDELLKLGEQAVTDQVEVFMCQRVIHPVLQHYLRRHGVLVVERLGIALIQPIVQMTGAQAVALYQTPIPPEAYGQVKGCCVRTVGSREMLHLLPPREPAPAVCTMVLCHRNDTMLNELKAACQRAEHVLRLTLRDPVALLGGGCTETHMAAYISNKGTTEAAEVALSLGVSQSQYLLGLDGFCSSLEAVALALVHDGETGLVDLSYAHHWSVPQGEAVHSGTVLQGEAVHSGTVPQGEAVHSGTVLQGEAVHSGTVPQGEAVHSGTVPQGEALQRGDGDEVPATCGCGLVERSARPGLEWTPLNTRYPSRPAPLVVGKDTPPQLRVLDSFTAKLNALQVAVEMANLVLDIRYVIQDVN